MRLLSRPSQPACLDNYRHGRDNWDGLSCQDKAEIRASLQTMQEQVCAYCERSITSDQDGHIEHFRQKNGAIYPQGTFLWENLFWSCNDIDSCGRHKDNKVGPNAYDYRDVIKMDEDDPDDFLHFVSDGTIRVRDELSEDNVQRAEETLRIFNLDKIHGDLRARRREAVRPFLETSNELRELSESHGLEAIREFFLEILSDAKGSEFYTAIRHSLLPHTLHKEMK